MVQDMKATGKIIRLMEEEDSSMLTEMYMKENGKTTRLTVKVFIHMSTALDMKESGLKINNTDSV